MIFFRPSYFRAIKQAVSGLKDQVESNLLEKFVDFLQTPDERLIYHANPRMVANHLSADERTTLRLLVLAVYHGILTLHWDVQCPACSGVDQQFIGLGDLRSQHTCPLCGHIHPTNVDTEVRVAFSIDERVRRLSISADDSDFRSRIDQRYGIVSGHALLTLQTFRDLFPKEGIPPRESLIIRQVTILFTDLAGSTELYARQGDTQAYSLVNQHFQMLFQVVDQQGGAIIKTIGDAIMAAFTNPLNAVKAALSMQQQMTTLNQQLTAPEVLTLKVGLDIGACVCVNLNSQMDYFGMTVNRAARVQSLSQGEDIVLTDALWMETQELLSGYAQIQEEIDLKGIDHPVVIHWIAVGSPLRNSRSLISHQLSQ
ncbi:MAG: adenylate/guanylate cyclase domain-containing protein [Leptolyngbyaceae cyanobacterium MO_188.B28]|nr:adenylate/guanylate cyclase domain-containing protein [Leptolyngbyaceae cyanobacterium MO_188.B28]